jgi:O-antigen/teichoic acid export membrane protein
MRPESNKAESKVHKSLTEFGVSTAKSGAVYVTAEIVSSIISLVIIIIATRLLGTGGFGLLSIAIAFSTVLGMAGNFGLGTALRRRLPQVRDADARKKYISSAYAVSCSIAAVLAIATFALSGYVANSIYNDPSLSLPLQIASILVFVNVFFNSTLAALVGVGEFGYSGMINIAYAVFQLALVSTLIYLGYGPAGAVLGLCTGLIIASVVGFILLAKSISFPLSLPSMAYIKELTGFSIPILVSNLSVVGVTNIAIVILALFASTTVVGNYSAAFRLGGIFSLLLTSSTFILLPTYTSALSRKDHAQHIGKIYNHTVYYSVLLLAPILAYTVANSTQLIYLLFSSQYSSAPFYLAVISAGTMLGIIGSYAGTLLISYGRAKKFMYYQLLVVAVEFVSLVLLTPLLQADGVLISLFVIAPIILDVVYTRALERQFSISIELRRLAGICLSTVIIALLMLLIGQSLQQGGKLILVFNLIVALLVYPPLLVLLRGVEQRNVEFVRQVSKRFGILGSIFDHVLDYTEFFLAHSA